MNARRGPPTRLIAGLQPVREAIAVHGSALHAVRVGRGSPKLDRLARFAEDQGAPVERVTDTQLDREARRGMHQGALAWASPLELLALDAVLERPALLGVVLDGVQDPQNFGAVVRSAVGLAGAAIIWGEHASAPLSTTTFRASAGAIEYATLCRVRSLVDAVGMARAAGVQCIGLDGTADVELHQTDLTGPTLLVLGAEGEGLGRAVRRACDRTARIELTRSVASLNVSVAAAVALYAAMRQRAS